MLMGSPISELGEVTVVEEEEGGASIFIASLEGDSKFSAEDEEFRARREPSLSFWSVISANKEKRKTISKP